MRLYYRRLRQLDAARRPPAPSPWGADPTGLGHLSDDELHALLLCDLRQRAHQLGGALSTTHGPFTPSEWDTVASVLRWHGEGDHVDVREEAHRHAVITHTESAGVASVPREVCLVADTTHA